MFQTPILFLIFNRPDTTQQVFAKIREIQPKQLFIAADGPRDNKEGEAEKCALTRQIVLNNIDWDCEVKTLFRTENLGCGVAPAQAITWFFDNVEQGIILEDDCLPDLSFFTFCEELLIRYKEDEKIGMIGGFNALNSSLLNNNDSYFYSILGAIWGWATWKNRWVLYDFEMRDWIEYKKSKRLFSIFNNYWQAKYREKVFDDVYNKSRNDVWDYQWTCARLFNQKYSVLPNVNLIENLGFGENATHYKNAEDKNKFPASNEMKFPLQHPHELTINKKFDDELFINTINYKGEPSMILRLRRKIAILRKKYNLFI